MRGMGEAARKRCQSLIPPLVAREQHPTSLGVGTAWRRHPHLPATHRALPLAPSASGVNPAPTRMTRGLPRGNAARRGPGPTVRVTETCAAENSRVVTPMGTGAGAPAASMATLPGHRAHNDRDLLPGCWSAGTTSRGLRCPGRRAATGATGPGAGRLRRATRGATGTGAGPPALPRPRIPAGRRRSVAESAPARAVSLPQRASPTTADHTAGACSPGSWSRRPVLAAGPRGPRPSTRPQRRWRHPRQYLDKTPRERGVAAPGRPGAPARPRAAHPRSVFSVPCPSARPGYGKEQAGEHTNNGG